jgi:peptide/nickel transport system ATP-binding protein
MMTAQDTTVAEPTAVLSVRQLRVSLRLGEKPVELVQGVDLDVRAGEVVALVGESGSGKSLTAQALLGLLPRGAADVRSEKFEFNPRNGGSNGASKPGCRNLATASERQWQGLRGRHLAMVFQDPQAALDPVFTIGQQMQRVIRRHFRQGSKAAQDKAAAALAECGLGDGARILGSYPHELSGGMRQRVMIALAISCEPELLVADEATSALDISSRDQVLVLLRAIANRHGTAILLISHDLSAVARIADRVMVMRAGQIVESGPTRQLLQHPSHPYTAGLWAATPRLSPRPAERPGAGASVRVPPAVPALPHARDGEPLLQASDLSVRYSFAAETGRRAAMLEAVKRVSIAAKPDEVLAIVGESGCGKSSLAKALAGLLPASSGEVRFEGMAYAGLDASQLRRRRSTVQLLFQEAHAALSPRRTILQSLQEPLELHAPETSNDHHQHILAVMAEVNLDLPLLQRYPHQLSGGQKQRVALARALLCNPEVIIADEPFSALDVAEQARLIDLLKGLREQRRIGLVLVAHDLAVVQQLADQDTDRVAVMYLGCVVELAPSKQFFSAPAHPYSQALLQASLRNFESGGNEPVLAGDPPSALTPPPGCVFYTRCGQRLERCANVLPVEVSFSESVADGVHSVQCHLYAPQ